MFGPPSRARVVEMSTEQVERRIAHALLRLAKQAGRKVEEGVEIDFPITRQDVAEMTGATLHTVSSRVLERLGEPGSSRGRQRIMVASRTSCFSSPKARQTRRFPKRVTAGRTRSQSAPEISEGHRRRSRCMSKEFAAMFAPGQRGSPGA